MHRIRFRDPAGSVRTGEYHGDEVSFAGRRYDVEAVDVLPPSEPTKILCIGLNYAAHAAESGSEVPDRPLIFLKGPNALAGHGDSIPLLAGKDRIDYEAELGVVIGEQCRHVDREDAMDVVEGFTCINDVSNRDDQREEQNWIRGKAFDNSAPMGPTIATPEHVSNPDDPRVRLWLNGELKQDSLEDSLVFTVSEAISELTNYLTLEPGDVVAMGTSGHPEPLSDGDTVEIEVDGVGRLEHDVSGA